MEDKMIKLEQDALEMKIQIVELKKLCDNLQEQIRALQEDAGHGSIILDGVADYYREDITKKLGSEKR